MGDVAELAGRSRAATRFAIPLLERPNAWQVYKSQLAVFYNFQEQF